MLLVSQTRVPFLESPGNFLDFSGPESCFMSAAFAYKIKVSVILKMVQYNSKINDTKLTGL